MFRKPLVLMASATSLIVAVIALHAPASANGDHSFSLRGFAFSSNPADESSNHDWVLKWRVTTCTPHAAKIRVRSITHQRTISGRRRTARSRFVRHQPAGCTQHRFQAFNDNFVEFNDLFSRLRVAWRGQRLRTKWRVGLTIREAE
jgi:hypothetical protein